MRLLRYVTHPEVTVDPATPIDRWSLSPAGRGRALHLLDQPWMATVDRVVSSPEAKALETAEILASPLGLQVEVRPRTGENDRSSTGFLPPDEFGAMADRFFAEPETSAEGWERAVDAQRRIVEALVDLLGPSATESTVVVGHGGVGTLWCCGLAGQPISRQHDQPGQGHYVTVDVDSRTLLHPWHPIDRIRPD